ncbi:unnamed protein product, partial [Ectocarpus fasciculatus]
MLRLPSIAEIILVVVVRKTPLLPVPASHVKAVIAVSTVEVRVRIVVNAVVGVEAIGMTAVVTLVTAENSAGGMTASMVAIDGFRTNSHRHRHNRLATCNPSECSSCMRVL